MPCIYIHIPFCKTKCTYCDFYSITNFKQQDELVRAMLQEIEKRKSYLNGTISTIYFGGGTPSAISIVDIDLILKAIFSTFKVENDAEITLEANPDDLSLEYLIELGKIGGCPQGIFIAFIKFLIKEIEIAFEMIGKA